MAIPLLGIPDNTASPSATEVIDLAIERRLDVGGGGTTERLPINIAATLNGATIIAEGAASNVVAHNVTTTVVADFSGIAGLDPGYVWGSSEFTTVGPAATDGDGIIDLTGKAIEVALQSSATAQQVVRASQSIVSLWGAASGGTVQQIEGHRISAPTLKNGALVANWAVANYYGLFVEAPGSGGINGAVANFAIFTAGGPSRFTGRLDVYGDLVQTGKMTLGANAFPVAPTNGDVFYRTDLREWYMWNGTRWLSTTVYTATYLPGDGTLPYTASASARALMQNIDGASDLWIENLYTSFRVAGGGTALDAANKWVGVTNNAAAGKTITIDSGASAADRAYAPQAINALLGGVEVFAQIAWTKTGTPGNLYVNTMLTYRKVAT